MDAYGEHWRCSRCFYWYIIEKIWKTFSSLKTVSGRSNCACCPQQLLNDLINLCTYEKNKKMNMQVFVLRCHEVSQMEYLLSSIMNRLNVMLYSWGWCRLHLQSWWEVNQLISGQTAATCTHCYPFHHLSKLCCCSFLSMNNLFGVKSPAARCTVVSVDF